MGAGKIAAQVAHASMDLARRMHSVKLSKATAQNTSKIVLYVDDLAALEKYHRTAKTAGHNTAKIIDEGITSPPYGLDTVVLGVGPIDAQTGKQLFKGLKLMK